MMKVSLISILRAHFLTLRNLGEERISLLDILIFFGFPVVMGAISWAFHIELSSEVYSVSISVFAIFTALLFSVQVAMYGVFRSDKKTSGDTILDNEERVAADETRKLLKEINANVSYLILVSCIAVTVFLVFFATQISERLEASILVGLYLHFLLTVAMVLKRAHEVFDAEYDKPLNFRDRD